MSFSSAHLPESAVPSIVRSAFSGSADRGTRLLICVNARGCHGQTLGSDAIQAPSRESTDELSPQVGLAWCARRGLWLGARAVRRRGSARLGLSDRPARTWFSREPGNLRVGRCHGCALASQTFASGSYQLESSRLDAFTPIRSALPELAANNGVPHAAQ